MSNVIPPKEITQDSQDEEQLKEQILEIQIKYNLNYFKENILQNTLLELYTEFSNNLEQYQLDKLLEILNKKKEDLSVLKMLKQLQLLYFGDLINTKLVKLILEYKKTKNVELQISEQEQLRLKGLEQITNDGSEIHQTQNKTVKKLMDSSIPSKEFDNLIQRDIYNDLHSSLFLQIYQFIKTSQKQDLYQLFLTHQNSKNGLICKAGILVFKFIEENQQQQQIKSESEQISEQNQIIQHVQTSMIKAKEQQKTSIIQFNMSLGSIQKKTESYVNKQSGIKPNQEEVSDNKQQQQQQQNSYIVGNGNKCELIKSQIKQTMSSIIQEKSKSKIDLKSQQKAPKVQFSLKTIMNSLIMVGKMMYKTQAYYDVFEVNDQYRMKYINDLIQMININLIVFDEIGLNNEDNKEIRNSILKMLDSFLLSHKFHSQIKEQFKFLQNYCTQPELKQIEPIQYDQNMPIIQESESLLEEQFQNFAKFQEDYKKGQMEDQDVEQQENPFLVCHMVYCKDDFYTKIINEAKRIKDKTSFNNFLLKLQNNLNQEAYIHFSTFLRLFNDFFNSKSTNWTEQLKKYCDSIIEQGRRKEVEQILIDYSQLGHKYCFQYLYTAIHYLQSEEQQNSSKDQSHNLVEQLDKI